MYKHIIPQPRPGLKDVWNAYMVEDVAPEEWSPNDIPYCPTTAKRIPAKLVSYPVALTLHKKMLRQGNPDYHINAFLHCYVDDAKFDGPLNSIWKNPNKLFRITEHYDGIITPDFSTYVDFPDPVRRYNTYRMRAMGRYAGNLGHQVINNARWGFEKTWGYDFDGLPTHSILSIGSIASGINRLTNRPLFESGLRELVRRCKPHTLIVYGSANLEIFDELIDQGIVVAQFDSETSTRFKSGGHDE